MNEDKGAEEGKRKVLDKRKKVAVVEKEENEEQARSIDDV